VRLILASLILALSVLCSGCEDNKTGLMIPESDSWWPQYDYFDPAWSPTGEYIAFGRGHVPGDTVDAWGLYVYNLADSMSSWIIKSIDRPMPMQSDISPNGHWILFSWYSQIWKCLATGDSLVQLTSGSRDFEPAWSPNGQRIAYYRLMSGIHIMNSDGSGDALVAGGIFPQWLDESNIVYVGLYDHIYKFDLETKVEERIFERRAEWEDVRELDADRSGARLLFSAFLPRSQPNIYLFDLGTSELTRLTTTGGDQPSWSPDGSEIVYTNTQFGRIWFMAADGSNKRPLSSLLR